jgi:hypothetical protein
MSYLKTIQAERQVISQAASPIYKLKRHLENTFPESCEAMREWWYGRISHQMLKSISARRGLVVQNGPFQNMRYPAELATPEKITRYALLPKIVGCYEAELHGILTHVTSRSYARLLNIGCSEGYYATGLLLRIPNARAFAFDIDPLARQLCDKMASLNQVSDRATIQGECTIHNLQELAGDNTLIISDCEGCELQLLRPDLAPGLLACDLIVELHDCFDRSTSEVVTGRFAQSHDTVILDRATRDPADYPSLEGLTPYRQRLAVSESRWGTPCKWAFMTRKKAQTSEKALR